MIRPGPVLSAVLPVFFIPDGPGASARRPGRLDREPHGVDDICGLAGKGDHRGWVIGEAFDDVAAADGIARVIRDTGQVAFSLTQWQLSRDDGCADKTIDVASPVSYGHYLTGGFWAGGRG